MILILLKNVQIGSDLWFFFMIFNVFILSLRINGVPSFEFAPMYQKSFSWFFEPATLMIFLCMICMTGFLFNTSPIIHLTFGDCRGQCWKSSWVSKGSNLIRLWLFFILLLKSWRCLYSRLSDKVSQNGPLILTKFGLKSTLWRGYNVWI